MSELRIIGKPRRRVDARGKVTGATKFADDLTFPRMLFCKLLRSPHPHANIISIDTSRAEALPVASDTWSWASSRTVSRA